MSLIERAENRRRAFLSSIDPMGQSALGQYFTPFQAARIIANMPRLPEKSHIRVLDPGAGSGILTVALIERLRKELPDATIELVVVEIDPALCPVLRETLADIEELGNVRTTLVTEDFISWALRSKDRFDLIVQNPPYSKMQNGSVNQRLLRQSGIIVPNIYAAFVALGVRLLAENGQQVSITPRSWMNGTYYSRFRSDLSLLVGIDSIHTFESRSKVFVDTGVLQEAIIVSMTLGKRPATVKVFSSHDHRDDSSCRIVPYSDVVTDDFIHVPASQKDETAVSWMNEKVQYSLADLGLNVSTGKVVDFRARDILHKVRIDGAWPMVHPGHIQSGRVIHPLGTKKAEWFQGSSEVASKFLLPPGSYVVIKRFSTKEERRRVVAGVWTSDDAVAFDNKLNYVHQNGVGLDLAVAQGLATFLNSSFVDDYFRVFSGHTQVNATDLKQMSFPSLDQLRSLKSTTLLTQESIDKAVEFVLTQGKFAP
jgi:adenine-specific DNA-methyltransferase